ncbi:MAG: (d)CMP kinase [Tannerella sp.]|jgi:cytidylate kinase|nr:(d)CMP kinase [Tannerella sp.]
MKQIIIAIDGLSSCGKSSMAKELARRLGYTYIDTGAMYRAVTLYAIRQGLFNGDIVDADALERKMSLVNVSFGVNASTGRSETYLNGENVEAEIRRMEVSKHVSAVSSLPFVRSALVKLQRQIGEKKGLVMDGRDIGTVVFPNAELKIFVTATPEIRAKRRLDEMKAKGEEASFDEILANVKSRDYQDTNRSVSPLRRAPDALELDNSDMTIAEQNEWLLQHAMSVISSISEKND